jgi:hypothetical protein
MNVKENRQSPLDGRRNSRRSSRVCSFVRYRLACLFVWVEWKKNVTKAQQKKRGFVQDGGELERFVFWFEREKKKKRMRVSFVKSTRK